VARASMRPGRTCRLAVWCCTRGSPPIIRARIWTGRSRGWPRGRSARASGWPRSSVRVGRP
jgi:hypothetical protein